EGRGGDTLGHRREKRIEQDHEAARPNRESRLAEPPERDRARREVEGPEGDGRAGRDACHFAAAVARAPRWVAMSPRYHSPLAFTRLRCVASPVCTLPKRLLVP